MKTTTALLWHEWRRLRTLFLAMAGFTVMAWAMTLALTVNAPTNQAVTATTVAALLLILYAWIGANTFSGDFVNKTNSFLLELPASSSSLYICKVISAFAAFNLLFLLDALLFSPWWLYFFGEVQSWLPALLYLPALALFSGVLLATLLSRNFPGGLYVLFVLPPSLLGVFAVMLFLLMPWFPYDEEWIIYSFGISWAALPPFLFVFGWWLWTRRLSRGLGTLRPALVAAGCLLAAPVALYLLALAWSTVDLHLAFREAKAQGLLPGIDKLVPSSPPIPDAENAAPGLIAFANQRYSDADRTKQDALLDEALKKPRCQFKIDKGANFHRSARDAWSAAYAVSDSLVERAKAAARDCGRFFACLDKNLMVADALDIPLRNYDETAHNMRRNAFALALSGPDIPEAFPFYQELIKRCVTPGMLGRDAAEELDLEKSCGRYSHFEGDVSKVLLLPRMQQSTAIWLHWRTKADILLMKASKTTTYDSLRQEAQPLEKYASFPPGGLEHYSRSPSPVRAYFQRRTYMAGYKIALALKAYRAKHGEYPESLAALCPEMLPELPVNAFNGNSFIYQRGTPGGYDSFMLTAKAQSLSGWSITAMEITGGKDAPK